MGILDFFRRPKPLRAKFDIAQTTADNRRHWAAADGLSARAALSPGVRRVIRTRSRYEAENNSWYSGIIGTAVNHIVGKGPRLQVLTASPEVNNRIEKAYRRWAKKIKLGSKLRTMVGAYWRDGETFVMRAERPRNWPMSLDLKVFESEQCATPWTGAILQDAYVDDGVRFDAATNEIEFYIYDHHPGANIPVSTLKGEWYSANDVLHLFRVERPGQTRGLPRATSALQTLPIMRRQELATLFSAESAANFAIYMKSNSSAVDPAAAPTDFAEMELARNMLTVIPEGWDLGQIEPKQPGPLYEMFQRQALMGFCRCTNMPYPLAAGTAMQSNFSSYKGDIRNVWKPEVVVEQDNIEERIADPIFMWFLQAAIYVPGLLDGAPPIDQIDFQWNWPPLPDIDPAETVATNAERMSTGQATPSMVHSENGQDWETEVSRFAQDLGVTVPEVKKALFDKLFGLVAPPSTQQQQQQQPQGVTQ